ncbi:MAG: transcriptional repressor NrdR [Syntrophomonadaceae bacterium]|jgi:transcriptional repressor NrdR|nr:transcriptional repressor NrdR [Syntrophomonadaceae bacterium]
MKCPFCSELESRVLDSRTTDEGTVIRRRRECVICRRRFTTYERIEERPLMVVKKEGNREAFQRDKLMQGILKAVEKRPIDMDTVEAMVGEIERELRDAYDKEVSSQVIGEKVMDRLRLIDGVAYVRFASVYRQFTDVKGFVETVEQLQKYQDSGEGNK